MATVPLWLFSLRQGYEWYYGVSFFAGELLSLYLAGFLAGFLLLPFTVARTARCKMCGAPMFLAGRHFDPLGSRRPHWSDVVIFVVFTALSTFICIGMAKGEM